MYHQKHNHKNIYSDTESLSLQPSQGVWRTRGCYARVVPLPLWRGGFRYWWRCGQACSHCDRLRSWRRRGRRNSRCRCPALSMRSARFVARNAPPWKGSSRSIAPTAAPISRPLCNLNRFRLFMCIDRVVSRCTASCFPLLFRYLASGEHVFAYESI